MVDWSSVEDEAVDYLSGYLRIDTTNPPGREEEAIDFLADILRGEGLEPLIVGRTKERPNLICRLKASQGNGKGLILLHHCDVVPAREEEWSVPPFGGLIKDGYVWGRGALDMKGMGIMELMAFLLIHREGLPLTRDLLLVVTCDEETGSGEGAEWLVRHHRELLQADCLINEGGYGLSSSRFSAFTCCVGEKGPLWVRLSARGMSGHGSIPHGENPCEALVRALGRVMDAPRPFYIVHPMEEFLRRLGLDGLSPQELETHPIISEPALNALFHDTLSVTCLEAGQRPNVIPSQAKATLDVRLLPGHGTQEAVERLKEIVAQEKGVELEVIMAIEASFSPIETELFRALEEATKAQYPHIPFLPSLSPGFTDSRCFRKMGIHCYGLIPVLLDRGELARVHGKDERLAIKDLVGGIGILYEAIKEMCAIR